MQSFHEACKNTFRFLTDELHFIVVEEEEANLFDVIVYRSAKCEIAVLRDAHHPGVFVEMQFLATDEIPASERFDLSLLTEALHIQNVFGSANSDDFHAVLAPFAKVLIERAWGLLQGDRELLAPMREVLMRRRQTIAFHGPTR
jgi:hypothetical protein